MAKKHIFNTFSNFMYKNLNDGISLDVGVVEFMLHMKYTGSL